MRAFAAIVVVILAMVPAGACSTSNDASVTTAPAVPVAPTKAPSEVVAVDATPIVPDGPSDVPSDVPSAGTRLAVGNVSIAVPDTWVPTSDQVTLDDMVKVGRTSTWPDSIDQTAFDDWSALIALENVMLAIDPASGHSASLVLTPHAGPLSPTDDPESWITAIGALTAETIPGTTYEGEPSTSAGHQGVRSFIVAPISEPGRTIEQFTTVIDGQLVTITVSRVDNVNAVGTNDIIESILVS